jgi:HKD family nuclease
MIKKQKINLNNLSIRNDYNISDEPLDNFSISSKDPMDSIDVIFKNVEKRLIDEIGKFEKGFIFGCVAWLTSEPILKALSKCDNVQILVQKEDFLRPDIGYNVGNKWKSDLRNLYDKLKCETNRYDFREPISKLSYASDPTVEPVRCVGNNNSDKVYAFPRMHNKFLIFCNIDDQGMYFPVALWTGSFNLTKNATYSFENALYLTDKSGENNIITAYLNEHHQIFALSEKLDWENEWSEPEYRIGT